MGHILNEPKIEYKFVDGTVTEIEVDGSLAEFMLDMKNEGEKVERRKHIAITGRLRGGWQA